jgi:hypothetical protein
MHENQEDRYNLQNDDEFADYYDWVCARASADSGSKDPYHAIPSPIIYRILF